MAVPANPLLSQVCAEFGAPATTPLSQFLRGGSYVPNIASNNGVPTALPISLSQLAGAVKGIAVSLSGTAGTLRFNPGPGNYTTVTPATATATPSGGSGYTYQWSFTSNPYGCTLANATSQTCSVSYIGPDSPVSGTLQCIVTATGGATTSGTIGFSLN